MPEVHVIGGDVIAGPHLTSQQKAVLQGVADGFTQAQIAATVGCGLGEVNTHLSDAQRQLGAHSRANAVAVAFRLGLIK